jgi:predicted exporter
MTPAAKRSLWWLAAAAVAAGILVTQLHLSFDLSAFLPKRTTLAHDILIEQVRSGPASRLLVIGIGGAGDDRVVAAGRSLQQALDGHPAFLSVLNGEFSEDAAAVPRPVDDYYLLMRDLDYSAASLQSAVQDRMQDLGFGGGALLTDLIARDPWLVTLDILESLAPAEMSGDPWLATNGSAVLLAETAATSIDIAAQATAIDAIHNAFAAIGDDSLTLDITGVGAFSVELQETIRAEATLRSILASAALLLVLFIVFRSPRMLMLSALPLLMGLLAGLTLVTLAFDTVHGITLAFGFTLLGIAVDYPLHLFSHAQHDTGRGAIVRIWPTMRLGAASTVVAYLALAFSNSSGLAQLGLFTAGGVVVASLVTRTWLPYLLPAREGPAQVGRNSGQAPRLSFLAAAGALAIAVVAVYPRAAAGLWDDKLSSLSPVDSERLAADQALRSATVTTDLRHQLALHAGSLEELLQASEALDAVLAEAVSEGYLDNWQAVTAVLPSERTQQLRRDRIPTRDELAPRLAAAVDATPFRADAFDAFLANAEQSRSRPPLAAADFEASPLRSWLDAHLMQLDGRWVALVSLVQPRPGELAQHIAAAGVEGQLIDFQAASIGLMQDYRNTALRTILAAALLIVVLLWWGRGELRQTAWIALTVSAALLITIAIVSSMHGSLTVIHMVALLLVLGLGLDYALFLSRAEPAAERRATDRGVLACAASTTIAFAILAASSIPVLKFLGLTVASGSLVSFLVAYGGSRLVGRRPS